MKLTIIGNSGAYPKSGQKCSCYLLQSGETTIALDFGSGAIAGISSHTDIKKLDGIILSHLHYDHMSDMLPMIYLADINDIKYKVFMPNTDLPQKDIITSCKNFEIDYIAENKTINIGCFKIEFCLMTHPIESYAMKISDGKNTLVYSGDTVYNDKITPFCCGADVAILDCGKASPQSMSPHMSIAEAEKIAFEANVNVIASHLDPSFDYTTIETDIIISYQDMIVEIEKF